MIKAMRYENELTFEICTDEAMFDFHFIVNDGNISSFKMDNFKTTIMNYFSVEDLPDYLAFEELTEIETLIIFEQYRNALIKLCDLVNTNEKYKNLLLKEFRRLEVLEIFKNILTNYKVGD